MKSRKKTYIKIGVSVYVLFGVRVIINGLLNITLGVQKHPHDSGGLFQVAIAIRRGVIGARNTLLKFVCVWRVICPGTWPSVSYREV